MKPRIGVYLSEQMAARLAAAAKRPGTTKSALVEAALAQFLGADDDTNDLPVDRRLSLMSRQLEELDRGLRIVNETVALQARFHLAVTPVLPAADQHAACVLGSERFDELAAQVRRRVQLGTSLMQETMDRLGTTKRDTATIALGGAAAQRCSPVQKRALSASSLVGGKADALIASLSETRLEPDLEDLLWSTVIGPDGKPEIVNYRTYRNLLIVDRLFAAAELRLGGDTQQRVRIIRSDGRSQ